MGTRQLSEDLMRGNPFADKARTPLWVDTRPAIVAEARPLASMPAPEATNRGVTCLCELHRWRGGVHSSAETRSMGSLHLQQWRPKKPLPAAPRTSMAVYAYHPLGFDLMVAGRGCPTRAPRSLRSHPSVLSFARPSSTG